MGQDGCGEQPRHSAMPPALAESRAGDNGGSPGHSAASSEAQQGAAPAEMPGSFSLSRGAAARGRRQLGLRWEKPGKGDPDTLHMYPAPGSDHLSLCPSLPQHPESSAAGPGVVLSRLLTDESLTSRPKKRKKCPQLSWAQVFAGSMFFELPRGRTPPRAPGTPPEELPSWGTLKKQGHCLHLQAGGAVCAAGVSGGF